MLKLSYPGMAPASSDNSKLAGQVRLILMYFYCSYWHMPLILHYTAKMWTPDINISSRIMGIDMDLVHPLLL
uniref:Uncharacterized protein n=1 Tax=Anguilla anguilla TaxID=7936 RepID=A0A0E9UBX8_ANGAN